MAYYKSQQELVKAITSNLEALEAGKLTTNELEDHLDLVRELYERTLVLRYKIFEGSVKTESISTKTTEQEITETILEEPVESARTSIEDEVQSIDFSLFDDAEEENLEIQLIEEPEIVSADKPESIDVSSNVSEPVQPTKEELNTNSGTNTKFTRRFDLIQTDIRGQFGFAKLDTLTGSFGLNERLQYINELFNGSSETFSEAIKHLDSLPNIEEVKKVAEKISVENEWDLDSETVEEFVQKLCRRYA